MRTSSFGSSQEFCRLGPLCLGPGEFLSKVSLLKCIELAKSKLSFDPHQKFWFGFSHGATVAVELMTTRRFAGAVVCRDGYTGRSLPTHTRERLVGLPIWVFSSADDVIFRVRIFSKTDGLIGRGTFANFVLRLLPATQISGCWDFPRTLERCVSGVCFISSGIILSFQLREYSICQKIAVFKCSPTREVPDRCRPPLPEPSFPGD
jgi:hypothetical protein